MKRLILFLSLIGMIGLFTSCEKDETKVVMLTNPIPPVLNALPDMTFQRTTAGNTIIFTGFVVDPGFNASATYFLEAAAAGTNFAAPHTLYSGIKVDTIKFVISNLNAEMLKKFPADQATSVDFRIKAQLVVDAGTGALGTSTNPLVYYSAVRNAQVTLYGLPRLNLINSGMAQKIESPLGNGVYSGFVKLDPAMPFTLNDPDNNINYGNNGGNLAVNGTGITASGFAGWYILTVNVPALTYSMEPYMIGLVGSATPNGWNTPDQKMDYNPQNGTWNITLDLIVGEVKFRKNDGWAWNLGGTPDNLVGDGANLPIPDAGNYTISLTITSDAGKTGKCTIKKN